MVRRLPPHMVPGGPIQAVGWPPSLAWPPGFSPHLAPPAPQQQNHQQQSQPQGGASGAGLAALDEQLAHCSSYPSLVVQPEPQSDVRSYQSSRQPQHPQQSEGVDRWQEEVQPQTQWQEHQSAWKWADGYYGYGNNSSNAWQGNSTHGLSSEDQWERKARASDQVWSTVGWRYLGICGFQFRRACSRRFFFCEATGFPASRAGNPCTIQQLTICVDSLGLAYLGAA